ncbi:three-Cys-motif partner protein TcmP [Lentzea pudingi]|nr:three-Cys-motif partner protein TcmP [Lentzea pudingi]
MPVHGEVPWPIPEHTSAKHDIYRHYLHRWFPILIGGANAYPSATYAEGFSGPGIYEDGEPGSPMIAIHALHQEVPATKGISRFLFIDDDPRCIKLLNEQLAPVVASSPRAAPSMPIKVQQGKCEEILEDELTKINAWGQPILAVLDSWGNAPVSFRLLQRLAANPSSEVIVTFEPQYFVRFVTELGDSADEVFGGDRVWRQVADLPDGPTKRRHLLDCYRHTLKSAGFGFLLDFELVDRRGNVLYLVFGTRHKLGVEKMKDALWEVDRAYGVGFRDPRDQQEEALFAVDEPQLAPLGRLVLPEIAKAGLHGRKIGTLIDYTLCETVFRKQHIIPTIESLRAQGKVETRKPGRITYGTEVRTPAS